MSDAEMRLFTAITMPENVVKGLEYNANILKNSGEVNLTRSDKYRLTLVYIGLTSRVNELSLALHNVAVPSFTIDFSKASFLPRRGGNLVWQTVAANDELDNLFRQITDELTWRGFSRGNSRFSPHVTLGRQFQLAADQKIETVSNQFVVPESFQVDNFHLLRSKIVEGESVYEEIDTIELY